MIIGINKGIKVKTNISKRKIILDFKEEYLNMSNNMISKKLVNSILLLLKKILGIA